MVLLAVVVVITAWSMATGRPVADVQLSSSSRVQNHAVDFALAIAVEGQLTGLEESEMSVRGGKRQMFPMQTCQRSIILL